ncbi:MAG: bifunctional ornithine acetyltransferase/N-acetylglutamate synthase, partial [Pseudomonadota bacterium]
MAAALKTSPLAPDAFPDLPRIAGVRFATCAAGVRYQNRDDVMLALCDAGAVVAGVFTKSSTRAAPVLDCQAKIGTTDRGPLAILVNAGNANAFTGRHGESAVTEICAAVAEIAETSVSRVLTSSTGVIGERLPQDKIIAHVGALHGALSPDSMAKAASAIITTDTFAKAATRQIDIGGSSVTVSGIAKGSGMIAPDMATMLVYLFTDAVMDQTSLQSMLS